MPDVTYHLPRPHSSFDGPVVLDRGRTFRVVSDPGALSLLGALAYGPRTARELAGQNGADVETTVRTLDALERGGVLLGTTPTFPPSAARAWSRWGIPLAEARSVLAARAVALRGPEDAVHAVAECLTGLGVPTASDGLPVDLGAAPRAVRPPRDATVWCRWDDVRSDVAVLTRSGGCPTCLDLRLVYNRPHVTRVGGHKNPLPAHAAVRVARTAAALLLPDAAVEGAVPPDAVVGETVWDPPLASPVPHLPLCPVCGPTRSYGLAPPPLEPDECVRRMEDGYRAVDLETALDRTHDWIDPQTGIGRAPRASRSGRTLAVRYRRPLDLSRPPALSVGVAGGKGRTRAQITMSVRGETAERVSGGHHDRIDTVTARQSELPGLVLAHRTLDGFSDRQYDERDAWNRDAPPALWVPEPYDDHVTDWVRAWHLTTEGEWGAQAWVPAAHAFYDAPGPSAYTVATSNGCSAGLTVVDAVAQALYELCERDATAQFWYTGAPVPSLDLPRDPYIDEARAELDDLGRDLQVRDLTTDLGIPVVLALSRRTSGPPRWALGFGCHLDARVAASRAVGEVFQTLPRAEEGALWRPAIPTDPPRTPRAIAAPPGPVRRVETPTSPVSPLNDVRTIVTALRDAGVSIYVVDQTHPLVGVPVVRVLAPGLALPFRRLGVRRLYEGPVRNGWVDTPLTEADVSAYDLVV